MISSIILAFVIGVLCGVGYMYLRYHKRIQKQSRYIDELARNSAWLNGRFEAVCAMCGFDLNEEKENDQKI